jgi:hypothetical protein
MDLYYDGFSNVQGWIPDAELENTNTIVWHTFHQRYWTYDELIKTPRWKDAERIFLVGQEGNISNFIKLDSRIHVWDSLVKPGMNRFYSYFWWWWQTIEVDQHKKLSDKLVDPLKISPQYMFDCLMGRPAPHRDTIYKLLVNTALTNQLCLITYKDRWLNGTDHDSDSSAIAPSLGAAPRFRNSPSNLAGNLVAFNGLQTANISTWLPWKIYNQSWFSIVAETDYKRNFFTEKTAKVLLGRKLFVYIGAAGALKDLRHLGFKTFDGIIDESYDLEDDDKKRWIMAFNQIKSVCAQQPEYIYNSALPIIEHNQKLMIDIDWRQRAITEMQKIVHGC